MNSDGFSAAVRAGSAGGARLARILWPIVFLVPLSWWADRGCSIAGVDPLYHSIVWAHERLGWFVVALALVSASVVAVKLGVARNKFQSLLTLAEPAPRRLMEAVNRATEELRISIPRMVFLDVEAPIATTVFGSTVLFSSGFLGGLTDDELELVVRHELVHVARRDGLVGVAWHLGFAALLVPGFGALQARLHAMRERKANVIAAEGRLDSYLALVTRLAHGQMICATAPVGLGPKRSDVDSPLVWLAPTVVVVLAIGLALSHMLFEHDFRFLITHHC